MSWKSILGAIAGGAGAPFTGGASLAAWMPTILGGAAAVGGALSNTKGARTGTSTPTVAPEYQTLSDLLRGRAEDRLKSSFDTSGIQANGMSRINDVFSGIRQSSDNNLTSRGLATSPVAGAVGANLDAARGGSLAEFLNGIPELQRQHQNEDMANAMNVLNMGRGVSTTQPGNAAGSAFGSAAEMLAFLSGKGILGGGKPKKLPGEDVGLQSPSTIPSHSGSALGGNN